MMAFKEFYERFGGSFRTKRLHMLPNGFLKRLRWCYEFLRGLHQETLLNQRFYTLPNTHYLPKDLIRLGPWEGEYLYFLAAKACRTIVEIGRFHGGSTFMLACANNKTPIFSIDNDPKNDGTLKQYFTKHGVGENVRLIVGDSQHADYSTISNIDMLFIDGDHSYQGCMNDLEHWYPKVVYDGHIVLHDSHHGSEVQNAVIDFLSRQNNIQIIRSPYIIESHWRTDYGSIAHFIKRRGEG